MQDIAANIEQIRRTTGQIRQAVYEEAQALAKAFDEQRTHAGQFVALALSVRGGKGRHVGVYWVTVHFKRNGKFAGYGSIRKRRDSHGFDVATLRRNVPEELFELVEATEGRCRQLREALTLLTRMDRDADVLERRLVSEAKGDGGSGGVPAATKDGDREEPRDEVADLFGDVPPARAKGKRKAKTPSG